MIFQKFSLSLFESLFLISFLLSFFQFFLFFFVFLRFISNNFVIHTQLLITHYKVFLSQTRDASNELLYFLNRVIFYDSMTWVAQLTRVATLRRSKSWHFLATRKVLTRCEFDSRKSLRKFFSIFEVISLKWTQFFIAFYWY